MANITVREGTSDPITLQCLSDGVAYNLTGMTKAELRIKDHDGLVTKYATTDTPPALLVVSDAVNGKLRFDRTVTTFLVSKAPYRGITVVTDATGKLLSFPEGEDSIFNVTPNY